MVKPAEELKTLKEKMEAIRAGDFAVEADNPKIVKCWERLACERRDCPAYGRLRCWSIAGTYCHGAPQGTFAQKLGDCRQCVVYRESCGDEIGELLEAFNQMVKDIRFVMDERERSSRVRARDEQRHAMEDMAAVLAHETRNPLHSIGLAAAYLKRNFHGELVTEFLSIIEEEVRKLNHLTSLFLSFSHPAPLQFAPFDVNGLVAAVQELAAPEARTRRVRLHISCDRKVPAMVSDQARLKEALLNVVENAVEAAPEGGEVRLASSRLGEQIRLSVTDNGPGIDPAEQERIFRPFYTTKTRGPGLGLAIVARTVRELGGTVEVESAPGRGSTFSLLLPLVPPEEITPER